MLSKELEIVAVVAKPSIGLVKTAFDLYRAGRPFAFTASATAASDLPGVSIVETIQPDVETGWIDIAETPRVGTDIAQISFTSGTTGAPKGILLSHDALGDTVTRLNAVLEIDSSIREYVGVPPNLSFGFGRFRAIAAVGGLAYLPPQGFDPVGFGRMLRQGEVNALAIVPTLARILINNPELLGNGANRLKWIELGSQTMTRLEKEALKRLFPNARIIQHYGLTEASRTSFLDVASASWQQLESVGTWVSPTEVMIGDDGCIRIRGSHVARERIGADGIHPLVDEAGWLTTSDLGAISDGHLFFLGRADDLINCGGVKLQPHAVEEQLFHKLSLTGGLAVARVPDPSRGEGVLVAFEQSQSLDVAVVHDAALQTLQSFGLSPGRSLHVIEIDHIPLTGTGKVQRAMLAELAIAATSIITDDQLDPIPQLGSSEIGYQTILRETADAHAALASHAGAAEIERSFVRASRGAAVSDQTTYAQLAGDSLSFIETAIVIQNALGNARDDWADVPLGELKAAAAAHRHTGAAAGPRRSMSPDILVRSMAIVLVVLQHAFGTFEGGADVMMVLAGLSWARLQRVRIAELGVGRSLWITLARLMVIYYGIVLVYSVFKKQFFVSHLLLYSTFLGDWGGSLNIYWFIESLVWCTAITGVAYAVTGFERVRRNPLAFTVGLFVVALGVRYVGELLLDAPAHRMRSPDQMLAYFAGGAVLADTGMRGRLMVIAILVALSSFAWGLISSHSMIMALCCLLLISHRQLLLPKAVHWLTRLIARNSFYIYIMQIVPMYLVDQILKAEHGRYWPLHIIASIGVGLGVGMLLDRYDASLRRRTSDISNAVRRLFGRSRIQTEGS